MNRFVGERSIGFVLLEVVLALLLLVGAAAVLLGGLNSAAQSVTRLERQAVAADLAVTALSGLQLGLIPPFSFGPERVGADFPGWEWEIVLQAPQDRDGVARVREDELEEESDGPLLLDVEVIVRFREAWLVAASDSFAGGRSEDGAEGEPSDVTYRLKRQVVAGARGFGAVFAEPEAAGGAVGEEGDATDDTAVETRRERTRRRTRAGATGAEGEAAGSGEASQSRARRGSRAREDGGARGTRGEQNTRDSRSRAASDRDADSASGDPRAPDLPRELRDFFELPEEDFDALSPYASSSNGRGGSR